MNEQRILIIDDDDFMAELLSITLNNLGYQHVSICIDGRDGVEKILSDTVDILILDLNMPGMSGMDILIRLEESGYQGGIVLFSGETESDFHQARTFAEEQQLNILGSLRKPATADDVFRVLGGGV